jgi:hypothetical protein
MILLGCLAIFLACVFRQIELPGLYMDAVNPDYLAVALVGNPIFEPPAWIVAGNLLYHRYPILVQVYHGAQTLWLGAPLFWLWGTNIVSLRLVHGLFGAAVLAAMFIVLHRSTGRIWLTAGIAVALALDPAFITTFRTQSYITVQPALWLLLSVGLLLRPPDPARPRRGVFASGICYGLAVYGYFIYAFFFPAVAWLVWRRGRPGGRPAIRTYLAWMIGALAGAIGYIVGYALIMVQQGGVGAGIHYILQTQSELNAFSSTLDLAARIKASWAMLGPAVLGNAWHNALMFGEGWMVPALRVKEGILLGVPCLALLWALRKDALNVRVALFPALVGSFFAVSLFFGDRLGGHHFAALLPLLYCATALGLHELHVLVPARYRTSAAVKTIPLLLIGVLAAVNLAGQEVTHRRLRETGGVGLFSDAINLFAAEALHTSKGGFVFFPDWGLAMPFLFLTGGQVEMDMDSKPDLERARRMVCGGRSVSFALVGGGNDDRFKQYADKVGAGRYEVVSYRTRSGTVVFQQGRMQSSDVSCGGTGNGG